MKADVNSILIYSVVLFITMILLNLLVEKKDKRICVSINDTKLCINEGKINRKSIIKLTFLLILVSLPLSILAGMRDGVGTDYIAYFNKFRVVESFSFVQCFSQDETEILFALFVKIAFAIGKSNEFVFFFVEFVTIFVALIALFRIRNIIDIRLGFFIYYLYVYHMSFNIIRQAMAMSFILLGLTFLIERNYISFIIIIFVSMFIHTTSIVCLSFIVIPLVFNFKEKKSISSYENSVTKFFLRIVFYSLILISPFIIQIILNIMFSFSSFAEYQKYATDDASLGLGTIIMGIPMIFPAYFLSLFGNIKKNAEFVILRDILLLYLPFSFIGYFASWASRLNIYPQMVLIILIPLLFKKKSDSAVALTKMFYLGYAIFIFIFTYWIKNFNQTFPFKFIN